MVELNYTEKYLKFNTYGLLTPDNIIFADIHDSDGPDIMVKLSIENAIQIRAMLEYSLNQYMSRIKKPEKNNV